MNVRVLNAKPHRLFTAVIRQIMERIDAGEEVILLVPEQLTLTAEREVMRLLKTDGLFTVTVLSPSSLSARILADSAQDEREPLSDAGRRMAVSLTLEHLEDQLPYYGSMLQRKGFVEKLSALISDFKRGGMDGAALAEYADQLESGPEQDKLKDLSTIYSRYEANLSGRFCDTEDRLSYVASRLAQSHFACDKHLFVYGFDTLPDQMANLLCALANQCASITVALICAPVTASDGDLYEPIRQGILRFAKRLRSHGHKLQTITLPETMLFHSPAIDHLDQTLFAHEKLYPETPDNVFLFDALTPFEEAETVARHIAYLRSQGMSPDDITVLYPEGCGYELAMAAALHDGGIPYYSDRQMPAVSHGLVRYLLCALRAMADGWREKDMTGLMKSGFSPLTFAQSCTLTAYAKSHGISGKHWICPFTRGDEATIAQNEPLRQKLMAPLIACREKLVNARSSAASATAVFELLTDIGAYEALQAEEERLLNGGYLTRASQNSQIWQTILNLLDQLVKLCGKARIPLKYLPSRMESGFASIALSSLPPAGQMLHIGVLGHLLEENARAVFVLGLNDGLFTRDTESLLSPEEREHAEDTTGCFLGLTDESLVSMAKLDLKRAMTLPGEMLYLSYSRTAADGSELQPLALVETLRKKLFPSLKRSPIPESDLPLSTAQSLSRLCTGLRESLENGKELSHEWPEKLQMLMRDQTAVPKMEKLLRAIEGKTDAEKLYPKEASDLFGSKMLSVSRLESFAACPFSHFINYGLRPAVQQEWKVDPIDTGSFFHACLENFTKLAIQEPNYPEVPVERVLQMAHSAIEPLTDEVLKGPMGDGERNLARFDFAKTTVERACTVVTEQLQESGFRFFMAEESFGYEGALPPIVLVLSDGREVILRGRIDRIDRLCTNDGTYLRVIDYKSSEQNSDPAKTWWGLQLQLLLYLDVCTKAFSHGQPAGALYFHIADPLVKTEEDIKALAEEEVQKKLKLKGFILKDVHINPGDGSQSPDGTSSLTLEQFEHLLKHTRKIAQRLADRLYNGETAVSPYTLKDKSPCDYCEFRDICRLDPIADKQQIRKLPTMNLNNLLEKLSLETAE